MVSVVTSNLRRCFLTETLKAVSGGDLDSTPVTKPWVHAEMATNLVNPKSQIIVANDDNYALAA